MFKKIKKWFKKYLYQKPINWINNKINDWKDKEWEPRDTRNLNPEVYDIFKENGEGVYYSSIVASNNTFVGKCISWLSGKFSHTIIMIYAEDMSEWFTEEEWKRLYKKYELFYGSFGNLFQFMDKTKIMVLGSADENGMNYFDYSQYQHRQQIISKPDLTLEQQKQVVKSLVTEDATNKNYDYTGLAFWWLWRALDDERAWYCSEQAYDVFKKVGYFVYNKDNPSPTQIAKYVKVLKNKIFSNVEE